MITTTVIWPQTPDTKNPTDEQGAELLAKAMEISPGFISELTTELDVVNNIVVATRTWPDVESAQQWVDYVLANYNVSSAEINPQE